MRYAKTTFQVQIQQRYPNGSSTKTHTVFGLSPREQREKMFLAIQGYDVHHADSPGDGDLKFFGPGPKL